MSAPRRIVLASGSRHRREQLRRLGLAVECIAPDIDECALPGEAPQELALRLAQAKAAAVAARAPGALLIGSDQVAELDGRVHGKPGDARIQAVQLQAASGHEYRFHTALCVVDTRVAPPVARLAGDCTRVVFRALDAEAIARYVQAEQPLDCAGSFKAEGLGIALFERIDSQDPTALVGLPLIALARLLRECGLRLP